MAFDKEAPGIRFNPDDFTEPRIVPPDDRFIEIVKTILAQNNQILEMNRELLRVLGSPVMYVNKSR